jgi:hypothetical protein
MSPWTRLYKNRVFLEQLSLFDSLDPEGGGEKLQRNFRRLFTNLYGVTSRTTLTFVNDVMRSLNLAFIFFLPVTIV